MLTDHATEALTDRECLDHLAEGHVGRVAVSVGALPAIYPVDYRLVDGDIVFLAGSATTASTALEDRVVAFEVDDLDSEAGTGWSVLVVGVARPATDAELSLMAGIHLASPTAGVAPKPIVIHPEFVSGRHIAEVIEAN